MTGPDEMSLLKVTKSLDLAVNHHIIMCDVMSIVHSHTAGQQQQAKGQSI